MSDPVGTLRYLDAEAVEAAMPDVATRLRLAEQALCALAEGSADLPPKIGVHPRPDASFAHAMPAGLRGPRGDGRADLLGVKWVTGFPTNARRGLPTIHATAILNDATTGRPRAILDAGPITAQRTAAVSGVAIRTVLGDPAERPPLRVAMLGAGVQARSHLEVLGSLLAGLRLAIHDRHRDRAESVASIARGTPGIAAADAAPTAREALADADVILTLISFGPQRQGLEPTWLPPRALVVAVDYDMAIPAAVARDAATFLTDDRAQFLATRATGWFAGYPDPAGTLGEALIATRGRGGTPMATAGREGRTLVSHLGVGLADVVFADAIVRLASARGLGRLL